MRRALCVFLGIVPLFGGGIPPSEYKQRRADVRKTLDGVMVLFGAEEPEDLHTAFFQESNFLYLSGWREPGAVMLLTRNEEILFLPPHNSQGETFTGRKTAADDKDAPEKTGFEHVLGRSSIESTYQRMMETSRYFYILPSDPRGTEAAAVGPFAGGTQCGDRDRQTAGCEIVR